MVFKSDSKYFKSALALNFTLYPPIVAWSLLPPVPVLQQYPPQLCAEYQVQSEHSVFFLVSCVPKLQNCKIPLY